MADATALQVFSNALMIVSLPLRERFTRHETMQGLPIHFQVSLVNLVLREVIMSASYFDQYWCVVWSEEPFGLPVKILDDATYIFFVRQARKFQSI